ncbi:hypothetical protein ILUMI_01758 [Ignelater luminosus]|uniref:Uncharacterized protein n=1 Tax=Ignelater luminosus TaxID=2038154 RepID=A0A8K0DHP6_IGNLU|nr:hypothetical protein ILUMI_01758 [Ignelater luminosus]
MKIKKNKTKTRCEGYKYLGSVIPNKGTSESDNKTKSPTKSKMHTNTQAIVEPILTYGSECWQMWVKDKRKVDAVEMDFLGWPCRVSRIEHIPNENVPLKANGKYTKGIRIAGRAGTATGKYQKPIRRVDGDKETSNLSPEDGLHGVQGQAKKKPCHPH